MGPSGDHMSSQISSPTVPTTVLRHLLAIAGRASLMRVVFGMTTLLDPRNKVVNPDADCLEHHPDIVAALAGRPSIAAQD